MLSLNKISQFPLHPSTMALAWLLIEFRLSGSYNSSQSHALSPPSAVSSRPHPNLGDKGERFYYSGDLLFTPPTLPVLSLPPSHSFILPHIARQLVSCIRLLSIKLISGYLSILTPAYWCGRYLYEPGFTAAAETGCQGAVLIMRDFEEV